MHFIPNPENKKEVKHLGNKDDNCVWMLKWATRSESQQHTAKTMKFGCKGVHKICPETGDIVETFEKKTDIKGLMSEETLRKYIDTGKIYNNFLWASSNKTDNQDLEGEIWVKLSDSIYDEVNIFPLYEVSNCGRIKGQLGRIMSDKKHRNYLTIQLTNGKICKNFYIHRLVLMAFNIPNPENKPEVDHSNTITHDNHLSNLKWATKAEQTNNEITAKNRKGDKMGGRKIIEVTFPDGKIELFYGMYKLEKLTGMDHRTIHRYAKSGESYNNYRFKIVK